MTLQEVDQTLCCLNEATQQLTTCIQFIHNTGAKNLVLDIQLLAAVNRALEACDLARLMLHEEDYKRDLEYDTARAEGDRRARAEGSDDQDRERGSSSSAA